MSNYLYGIVPAAVASATAAATSKQLRAIPYRDVAALASSVSPDEFATEDVRVLRRQMKSHAEVLNRIVAQGVTVLPFSFGIVFPSEKAVVERVLAPQHARLIQMLRQLDGHVELKLKAEYQEKRVLAEVVAEQPNLSASASGRGGGGSRRAYQSKIEVGRRVAAAIEAKRQQDARRLLAALSPLARDVRVGAARSDLTVLSASFLVDRRNLDRFDEALAKLNQREQTRLKLDCVGPFPAYSFVEMKV